MNQDDFLKLLACPRCATRPPLRHQDDWLICTECGYGYKIENGIPNLIAEEAVSPADLPTEIRS